ncbi:hypothetical protein AAZV13_02G057900 [Glycine max]
MKETKQIKGEKKYCSHATETKQIKGQTARPNTLKNLRKRDVARRRPLSSWNMEMQEILWVKAHEPPLLWVVQFDDEVEDMSTLMEEDRRCSLISASFQHVGQFFTLRARAIQGGGNAAALSGKDSLDLVVIKRKLKDNFII